MTTASATEVKNRLGQYLDIARKEPVHVQSSGRKAVVIISAEEYERLITIEDHHWGNLALEAKKKGEFVGHDDVIAMVQSRLDE